MDALNRLDPPSAGVYEADPRRRRPSLTQERPLKTTPSAALAFILVCCGIMLGAGLGAFYGSVAFGLLIGGAVGGLAAALVVLGQRARKT